MDWNKLKSINENLKTIDVKGKEYVEVNKRVIAFRELEVNGSITTEIVSLENGVVVIKATVADANGHILGTGYAYEKESSTFINKTSYIENCETSAVGRALGFCGIGIDVSIASAEEVKTAIHQQESVQQEGDQPITATHVKALKERIRKINGLTEEMVIKKYNLAKLEDMPMSLLADCNKDLNKFEAMMKKSE